MTYTPRYPSDAVNKALADARAREAEARERTAAEAEQRARIKAMPASYHKGGPRPGSGGGDPQHWQKLGKRIGPAPLQPPKGAGLTARQTQIYLEIAVRSWETVQALAARIYGSDTPSKRQALQNELSSMRKKLARYGIKVCRWRRSDGGMERPYRAEFE